MCLLSNPLYRYVGSNNYDSIFFFFFAGTKPPTYIPLNRILAIKPCESSGKRATLARKFSKKNGVEITQSHSLKGAVHGDGFIKNIFTLTEFFFVDLVKTFNYR